MIRQPVVSGSFYEGNKVTLINSIEQSFKSKFGPEKFKEDCNEQIIAAVSPHAGYFFSGACAANVYNEICRKNWEGTIAILGFSHQGLGTGLSDMRWATPLGISETDTDWIERLKGSIPVRNEVHSAEHSIEVQIPFIQHISSKNNQKIKLLCLSVSRDMDLKVMAKNIIDTAPDEVIYIASSDFTHYGRRFGYAPYGDNAKTKMKDIDLKIAETVSKLDRQGFDKILSDTKATVCGVNPIRLLIEILKLKKVSDGNILRYYTSGDILGDYNDMVGYCSIVWR